MTKQEEDAWLAEVDLHVYDYDWLDDLHSRMLKRQRLPVRLIQELTARLVEIRNERWRNRQGRRAY